MAECTREQLTPWEDFRIVAEEFRELDEEHVFVLDRAGGRGKSSGLDVAQMQSKKMGARLFHVRGGKVTRVVFYWGRDRALADLGLAPEAGAAGSTD